MAPSSSESTIDIPGITGLISSASTAQTDLGQDSSTFGSILSGVDVDSSPANGLVTVSAWLADQIPGLRRRLALAQYIEAQKPGLQTVVTIPEKDISNVPPQQAIANGQAAAKSLLDSNGNPSTDLINQIKNNQNDPYFAKGLAGALTPAQLSQIVLAASSRNPGADNSEYYGTDFATDEKNWQSSYGSLLSALGTTVGTATRSTSPDLSLGPGYAKSFADAIDDQSYPQGGDARYGQAGALSLLLRYGQYGQTFLNDTATQVYNYERSSNQDGMWHDRSWDPSGNFEGVYAPDGSKISDPLAGIMSGLGNNPLAAQEFFSQGKTDTVTVNGQQAQVNDRLKYLIQDRTWASDIGSDNGNGLGAALQAATTYFRDNSPSDPSFSTGSGQTSAQIAGQTFYLIGSKTGDGQSDGSIFGIGSHEGWKMWDAMRPHIANIVASYSPDLIRMAGVADPSSTQWTGSWNVSDPSNSLFPPNGPASAWMDPTLMQKIIGTLGEDPKNMDIVNAGIAASGRLMLNYALQNGLDNPNAPEQVITNSNSVPSVDGATSALAYALNFSITAGYHGDKNAQAFEQARAENISKIIGVVTSVPSLAVPEDRPWTAWLVDQVKDQALDKLGEGPDQNATDTYNDTSSDYQTQLQQMTMNALLANGYLSDQNYKAANAANPGSNYTSPYDPKYADQNPPAVTVDSDGTPHFNFDSQAYKDWVQSGSGPATGWTLTHVVDPFRANLPAYGG